VKTEDKRHYYSLKTVHVVKRTAGRNHYKSGRKTTVLVVKTVLAVRTALAVRRTVHVVKRTANRKNYRFAVKMTGRKH